MQSAFHVESTNRGKIVYPSHTTPSVSCRKGISLDGTMLAKFFENQGQFMEVTIISISIM